MSNFTVAIKLLVVFGLLSLLIGLMFGGTSPFDDLSDTLSVGVDFPDFDNPFTTEIVRKSAYADFPFEYVVQAPTNGTRAQFHGCVNTTLGRAQCLQTPDGDESYVRVPIIHPFKTGFQFNYSDNAFKFIGGLSLRGITVTMQCRTEVNETSVLSFLFIFANVNPQNETQPQEIGFCPMGEEYQTFSFRRDFPGGVSYPSDPDAAPFKTPYEVFGCPDCFRQFGLQTETFVSVDPLVNNVGTPAARFTYFRIDVDYAVNTDCQPPEGAWFPFVDEIACAIINFGNAVWKGIQFVINGVSFILVTLGVVLVFLGQVVFGLLIGIINMATWFLTVDAPDIVKSIFGIFTITAIAFPILTVAQLIRGSE
jgi:hypothetical protein